MIWLKPFWLLVFYIFVALVFLWPQLYSPGPNIIDDPSFIVQAKNSSLENFVRMHFMDKERFRPIYWMYRYTLFHTLGDNIPMWFVSQALLLASTFFALFLILSNVRGRTALSFLLPLFLFVFPTTTQNYYRLGTAEPLQILFLLTAIFSILKSYSIYPFFLIGFLLTKETGVFYLLPLLVTASVQKNQKALVQTLFIGLLIIINYLFIYSARTGYSTNFSFSFIPAFAQVVSYVRAFPEYFLFFFVALLVSYEMKKLMRVAPLYLFCFSSLVPLFFWFLVQDYYLYPFIVFSLVLFAIGLRNFLHFRFALHTVSTRGLLAVVFFVAIAISLLNTKSALSYWHREYMLNGALTRYLLSNNFSIVSTDTVGQEEVHKIFMAASHYESLEIDFKPDLREWLRINSFNEEGYFHLQKISSQTRKQFATFNKGIFITRNPELLRGLGLISKPLCAKTPFMEENCRWYVFNGQYNKLN